MQEINGNIVVLICQIYPRHCLFSVILSSLLSYVNFSTFCNCSFLCMVNLKETQSSCYFRTFPLKFGSSSFVNRNGAVFFVFRDFYFKSHFLHFCIMVHFFPSFFYDTIPFLFQFLIVVL